ncbi:MAG: protein arginine kinase [Candidatus Omnitrophica bacterium]|nr:protein arginine kinase [Candidatus Omnitrophota bacterium]
MKINDLLNQTSEWLKGTGPNAEIILSTRIRLARNIENKPFSNWATKEQMKQVFDETLSRLSEVKTIKAGMILSLKELAALDRQFLVERHLMSKEHAMHPDFKGLLIGKDEVASVMINEEDHLRIQVLGSGFNLRKSWELADKLDDQLSEKITYAFSLELGYLTACPTNTGTGMRASVMAHLPALVMTKRIGKLLEAITKFGLTTRGLYGEGTEASGNIFQVSNSVTLGQSEEDTLEYLERFVKQLISHEENARRTLLTQQRAELEDRVWRAYGVLRAAHIITSNETIDLLSTVRLGVDLGIIKEIDRLAVNELFIATQPAHLQKMEGKELTPPERDVKRAAIIRARLGETRV